MRVAICIATLSLIGTRPCYNIKNILLEFVSISVLINVSLTHHTKSPILGLELKISPRYAKKHLLSFTYSNNIDTDALKALRKLLKSS